MYLVKALYCSSRLRVRAAGAVSEEFEIDVEVHQRSSLSRLLFIIVMEEATKEFRGGGPWELLYADDIVITAESRAGVEEKFRMW